MAKRQRTKRSSGVVCPQCGLAAAQVIGRNESLPIVYLRCSDCGRTSVVPE